MNDAQSTGEKLGLPPPGLDQDVITAAELVGVRLETPRFDVLHRTVTECLPTGQVETIYSAAERGPCGGVRATLLGIEGIRQEYQGKRRIAVNAPPTNGADSNANFKKQGIEISVKPEELKPEDILVISAHGNPRDRLAAEQKGITVFDTTCGYVYHTHEEIRAVAAKVEAEEKSGAPVSSGIIYISINGHPTHPERKGTSELAADLGLPFLAVERIEDIPAIVEQAQTLGLKRLRIVSQTTNNAEEAIRMAQVLTRHAQEVNPDLDVNHSFPFNEKDICLTIVLRQKAIREMVREGLIDTLIIVGSVKSKNTTQFVGVAIDEASQVKASQTRLYLHRVILANSWEQLPGDIEGRVGIVSGASTYDENIDGITSYLGHDPAEVILVGKSDIDGRPKNTYLPIERAKPEQKLLASLVSKAAARNRTASS